MTLSGLRISKLFASGMASFILSIYSNIASPQGQTLFDSFGDDNFTSSPIWGGTTTTWQVIASSDVSTCATNPSTLRLNTGNTTATEYLSTQVASWGTFQEWCFFFGRRGQGLSVSNAR